MSYVFIFALMYILLFLVVYLYALLLQGERYPRRPRKPEQPTETIDREKKEPPKPNERLEGANCITWDAQTGEVLDEKVL